MAFEDDVLNGGPFGSPFSQGGSVPLEYPMEQDRLPGHVLFRPIDENDFPLEFIKLPLPPTLGHSDKATYDGADLGVFAMPGDIGMQATGQRLKSLIQNIDKGQAAQLTKDLTTKLLGPRTEYATKTTPNPNTRSLFKKVGIREFSFDYDMIPTSPEEAMSIEAIIKKFRAELYPESTMAKVQETVNGTEREESYLAYKYPNRFSIKFYLGGLEIEPKIYPCYLTSVDVQYNSAAILASMGGRNHFAEYKLKLSFVESTTLFNADVAEGGY